jgi:NAD(P)-dependent dehydrogenase (short-subunit alcohol dehydrogenase family)
MTDLKDKVAFVTGASGNLGGAVVRRFSEAGARLVLVDRAADRLPQLFPDLAEGDRHHLAGGVDATDAVAFAAAVAEAKAKLGGIDILVNTVGGFRGGPKVHEEDLEAWDFLYAINLKTTVVACHAVVPVLLEQRHGRIINTAAGAGLTAPAGLAAYSASKAGVLRLTEALAQELKSAGITANAVLPGTIDTPQNRKAMPGVDFGKWVTPEAIADVILFLASDAARAVTGAALPVTGRG